jgi:hypothetical protein
VAEIITIEEFRQYLRSEPDSDVDEALTEVLKAASEYFRGATNLNFDQRAYVETRNGPGRKTIMVAQPPVAASPLPTVVENGKALIVAAGYSETADVVVDLADGFFHRRAGSTLVPGTGDYPAVWSRGAQNVVISYTGGYPAASMPADARLFVKWLAALYWQDAEDKRTGVARRGTANSSVDFLTEIPPMYQDIVERWRRPPVID